MILTGNLAICLVAGITVGAVTGSFAATAAMRLVEGRDIIGGRSVCDGCNKQLTWYETIPFFGYAVSRGHCRGCSSRIDPFHLIGEGLGAVTLTACLLLTDGLESLWLGVICICLLITALIDFKTFRLPDILTVIISVAAIGAAYFNSDLLAGLISAATVGGVLFVLRWFLGRRVSKPVLGLGDVKLAAALAIWLGFRTPAMIALAASLALLYVLVFNRRSPIAFGPFIAIAAFVMGLLVPKGWLT